MDIEPYVQFGCYKHSLVPRFVPVHSNVYNSSNDDDDIINVSKNDYIYILYTRCQIQENVLIKALTKVTAKVKAKVKAKVTAKVKALTNVKTQTVK